MQKPNGYDEVSAGGGDWTPVALGGHMAVIKGIEETVSRNGKPMVKVAIDFDSKDDQPGYFAEAFKNDDRPDKKWPAAGMSYIMSVDQDGKCSKSLKSFITAVEKSNNFTVAWLEDKVRFAAQFKNKLIGAVYGEVEEEYNGKVSMRHKLRWFCEYQKALGQKLPAPKYLNGSSPKETAPAASSTDFLAVDEDAEEVPF